MVHELTLLPNNTASATFLPNGEQCEVVTGYLTWGDGPGGGWGNA